MSGNHGVSPGASAGVATHDVADLEAWSFACGALEVRRHGSGYPRIEASGVPSRSSGLLVRLTSALVTCA